MANCRVIHKERAEEESPEIKDEGSNGDIENEDPPSAESKSAKKKKRKDEARKEVKESLDLLKSLILLMDQRKPLKPNG